MVMKEIMDFALPWQKSGKMEAVASPAGRFWEIDFLRGSAIVMMVVFHAVFDLAYMGILGIRVSFGPWRVLAITTATIFLFLVGLSLTISSARAKDLLDRRAYVFKFIRRGVGIFILGLLITLVTLLLVPQAPILFGILHLIGVSVMLAPLYLPYTRANLVAGLALIAAGAAVRTVTGPEYLLWLGIHPAAFSSLDYTPLVPWLGVVLVGVFTGKVLYPGGLRRFNIPDLTFLARSKICFLGRHSLIIYLVHQPAILLVIFLVWGIPGIG
jgi:uncharacterized membrane protein